MVSTESTTFIPFCGWYKCQSCGVTELFVPSQCPVCGKLVENYERAKTERLREKMINTEEDYNV